MVLGLGLGLKGIDELKKGERIERWKEVRVGCNHSVTSEGSVESRLDVIVTYYTAICRREREERGEV